ncbi:MAG: hypothetical protein ABEJ61_05870 [Haloferacaceae archaeon]
MRGSGWPESDPATDVDAEAADRRGADGEGGADAGDDGATTTDGGPARDGGDP